MVLELIEGETLEQRLRGGPLPMEDSLRTSLQIAGALEAAHAKGIVHRDLKPANVMVDTEGTVKVLDLGDPSPSDRVSSDFVDVSRTRHGTR